ncbi:MAG: glycosyltransferase family 4 protein [Alistipes sp.]|nr:glycosyltransferase family 4 protein [Alistipes sp.]
MKILLVSFYFSPELGAAPSRITNMANGFKSQGDEVDILTCLPNYPKGRIFEAYRGRLYKKEIINGCNVYRYWTYATVSQNPILRGISMVSFAVMIWLFAFRRSLVKNYDRIIIQSPPLPVAASAIALFKCLYNKKTILNISDLWPLSAVELGAMAEGDTMHKIFSKIERFNYKKADAILGQSNEILKYVAAFKCSERLFLYRNLQKYNVSIDCRSRSVPVKIVYAGLLGVAQNLLDIIKNVDFKTLGVELHLYGGGNQTQEIETFIAENDCNVYYHGYIEKERMAEELTKYDASIIPLAVRIKGAVPSKIFDILPMGIPVLFCGGGEGAEIVTQYEVGLVSMPGDYAALQTNVKKLVAMSDDEYRYFSMNCIRISRTVFDFDQQITECRNFIDHL